MKRNKFLILSAAFCLVLLGCIPSLQPFYTENDLVFDRSLLGKFVEAEKEGASSDSGWTFEKADGKSYKLTIREKEKHSPFVANLFKLEEKLYLDLLPDESGLEETSREPFYRVAMIPGHMVFKVVSITPSMKLQSLEYDWLKEFLEKNPSSVPHAKIGDRLVLTGTTEQMQEFLKKISLEAGAWSNPGELRREEPKGSVSK